MSPLVRFQLPNVLFAYAHTLALYHGGDDALLSDFCATLLGVSGALGAQQVFASVEEALQAAAHVLEAGEHPPGPLGTRGAMHEVARILWVRARPTRKATRWQHWETWQRPWAVPGNRL